MVKDYILAVIIDRGNYAQQLENLGYIVYRFNNNDSVKAFLYHDYLDVIINEVTKTAIITNTFLSFILTEPLEDTLTPILEQIPDERDFSEQLALSMLDNNHHIYYNILRRYYNEYNNLEIVLKELVQKKAYPIIKDYIHKIKGISLNIGSQKLYGLARLLEKKFKSKQVTNEDINMFIQYHRRIIKYCKQQGD
ncbi:MAG: hypothetical protein M0R05_06555 [Bacilli bacterium]|nr:hypothetical protein [Bacilli bacterium]MDD4077542.1 hypothetical protein [Bacilli bacterium]MDD4388591.1 hypothetical protein [Bacilli bacterium]